MGPRNVNLVSGPKRAAAAAPYLLSGLVKCRSCRRALSGGSTTFDVLFSL